MRVLMLVWTDVATDTRVLREATALVAGGHTVHVVGRDVPDGYQPPTGVTVSSAGGTSALKRSSGSVTSRPMSAPVRAARWLLLPQHVAAAHAGWVSAARRDADPRTFDVVHAHDFTALPLGAELAGRHGVPLVYDTHEYWYGRHRSARPTPVQRRRERAAERRLGGAAAAVVAVSPAVADRLRQDYGWSHVSVVRNTFPRRDWGAVDAPMGSEPTGLVYAGRIGEFRELETVAAAAPDLDPLEVTLVGPADPTYLAAFRPGRVRVLPPVSVAEVDLMLRRAGLALVTQSDRWTNHRLTLPNRLFQAVAAGVPVVASDSGELAATVRRYRLGTVYRPGDAASLVDAARAAVADYASLRESVEAATADLSWEHDGRRLLEVYERLPGG